MRRLESFVQQLAEDLARLQAYVHAERFQTDEYAFIIESCLRGVAENYQAEELTAFRGVLVNSAIGDDLTNDAREYFVNLVGTLSVLHMRILWFLDDPEAYIKQYSIPASTIRGGFGQFMPAAIPGVSGVSIKSPLLNFGWVEEG